MAIGVRERFQLAIVRSTPSKKQHKQATKGHQRIRELLIAAPEVVETRLSGSFRRKTANWPLNDVDMLVEFKKSTTCDVAKTVIRRVLHSFKIMEQAKSFNVQGGGLPESIGFDVVPVRKVSGRFQVATREGKWLFTAPKEAIEACLQAKGRHGSFVPLLRLLKAWNATKRDENGRKVIKSFHLEVLSYHVDFTGSERNMRGRFAQLLEHVSTCYPTEVRPPGSGEPFPWSDTGRQLLLAAARLARRADKAEQSKAIDEAHRLWKELLGDLY